MRIAIPSIVIDFAPLWIARDKGIFREEGIEVEITYIQGNIRGVQSLLAGEVQAGIAGSAGPIGARAAGEDAVIVAVPMNRLDYTFVARQPVKSPGDLAGKKIGIGAVGGSDEVATRIALRQLGVDPAQVTMLVIGGSAERLAALRVGSVDAAHRGWRDFYRRRRRPLQGYGFDRSRRRIPVYRDIYDQEIRRGQSRRGAGADPRIHEGGSILPAK